MMKPYLILAMVFLVAVTACEKDADPLPAEPEEPTVEFKAEQWVLIEPTTSTTCGACPLAHHVIEEAEAEDDHIIHMTHYLYGPLHHEYTEYLMQKIDKTVFTPLLHIQRSSSDGSVVYYGIDRLDEIVEGAQNNPPQVEITLSKETEENGVVISAELLAEDGFKGEGLHVTVVLVEKSVTGTGQGYDQRNYGHEDPDHPYYQQGEYIEGFEHTNVIREVLTAFDGDAISLDEPWMKTLDHSALEQPLEAYAVIAFIHEYNEAVQPIINAQMLSL